MKKETIKTVRVEKWSECSDLKYSNVLNLSSLTPEVRGRYEKTLYPGIIYHVKIVLLPKRYFTFSVLGVGGERKNLVECKYSKSTLRCNSLAENTWQRTLTQKKIYEEKKTYMKKKMKRKFWGDLITIILKSLYCQY